MTKEWTHEEVKINEVFSKLYAAWNRGDGDAFADCCTEDVDYVTFFGQHLKDKQEVAKAHQELFDGVLKGSQMQGRTTNIRFLDKNTAIAHCVGSTKMRWQKDYPKKRESINTNVLVNQNGEWKISAFHNCRIKEPNFLAKWFIEKGKKQTQKN